MRREYTRPEYYDEKGLRIYYTSSDISTRGKAVTRVKMSFRKPKARKTIVEGQPEYGKILYIETRQVPDDLKAAKDPILATVERYARSFYCSLLKKLSKTAEGKQLLQNIPFAVACEVWLGENDRAEDTLLQYEKTYKVLCQDQAMRQWLKMPSNEIVPSVCNRILYQKSFPVHTKVVTLIRAVIAQEVQKQRLTDQIGNICTGNVWDKERVNRPHPNRESIDNINRYIRPKVLEPTQVQRIVSYCQKVLTRSPSEEKKALCLMSLFVCCLGLPVRELLYMRVCDIIPETATTPKCVLVLGTTAREKGKRENPYVGKEVYKQRLLPVPTVISEALELAGVLPNGKTNYLQNFEEAVTANIETRTQEEYLFHAPKNKMRHMLKEEAIEKINEMLREVIPEERCFLDGQGELLGYADAFNPYNRMLVTPENALCRVGMEEDELRYMKGLVPNTVAAEAYIDFTHEREVYRMWSLLNLSLQTKREDGVGERDCLSLECRKGKYAIPGEVVCTELEAVFPEVNDEQPWRFSSGNELPWIRISAEYGYSISAQFEEATASER